MSESSGRCVCCAFACGVCKILCFTVSHVSSAKHLKLCCCRVCGSQPPPSPKPEYAVLCIGLKGVGKSSLLACTAGENTQGSDVQPTNGFSIKALLLSRAVLNVKELGGGEKIRPYWNKYYSGHEAIVFVVDSSCSEEELSEAGRSLEEVLGSPTLMVTPLLVLCSKQDQEDARAVDKIGEKLCLQELVGDRPHLVRGCSTRDKDGLVSSFELLADLLLPEI